MIRLRVRETTSLVRLVLLVFVVILLSDPTQASAARLAQASGAELQAEVEALREEVEELRELVGDLTARVSGTGTALATFRPPTTLQFAGQRVPLEEWDVAERLEREFYLALAEPAHAVLWLKRSARYFPYMEEKLRAAGLPDDLKYVAVAESALRPRAYSWAHASGLWQFIPETGRRYGLRVTPAWDERRDPERSTTAAIAYLSDLYTEFRDWPLALAAYNAGAGRVADALRAQGVSQYFQLVLPTETERYVFRVLAAKLLLEAPERYGVQVPLENRYAPHAADVVTVPVKRSLGVRELATAVGSFSREIRLLNPAIMEERLPKGRYDVRVPRGTAHVFTARLAAQPNVTAAPADDQVRHRVRNGDTLVRIARRYGVSVDHLRKWNRAIRRGQIYPGQILVIRSSKP